MQLLEVTVEPRGTSRSNKNCLQVAESNVIKGLCGINKSSTETRVFCLHFCSFLGSAAKTVFTTPRLSHNPHWLS